MIRIFELIRSVKHSKDGKVLLENFFYLTLLQVSCYIFPIFTFPYLARVLGVEYFGRIAFALIVIGYFQTFVDWGFNFSSARDIARNREDVQKVSEIFSNVTWARLFIMAISFVFLLVLICVIPKFRENTLLLLITFCFIIGQIMLPEWLFQGLEKMKYITIMNFVSRLIFTILVFFVIKDESDYLFQPLLILLGGIISGVWSMYLITKCWGIKLKKPTFSQIKITIYSTSDLFINTFMPNLYNSFSTLLLGFCWGNTANGLFDAGNRFATFAYQMLYVLSRTFFPFLSRRIDKHNFYAISYLSISIVISCFIFIIAPYLINFFFTSEFQDAIIVLRILSISIIFLALCNVYGTNYLVIVKEERLLRNITFISSLVGFACSIPLVYYWGFIGAAITITLSRGILGVFTAFEAVKIKKRNLI